MHWERIFEGSSLKCWKEGCTVKERNVTKETCDEFNGRHAVFAVAGDNLCGDVVRAAEPGEQVLSVMKTQPWEPHSVDM